MVVAFQQLGYLVFIPKYTVKCRNRSAKCYHFAFSKYWKDFFFKKSLFECIHFAALLGVCWLRLAAHFVVWNWEYFLKPGSLSVKFYIVLGAGGFYIFGFDLSRSSVNGLIVVCSERCLADDASMDRIYFSFSFSLPLCLYPLHLSPPLSFAFCSPYLSTSLSFMDFYPSLFLSSFSMHCGAACSPEMQAG